MFWRKKLRESVKEYRICEYERDTGVTVMRW